MLTVSSPQANRALPFVMLLHEPSETFLHLASKMEQISNVYDPGRAPKVSLNDLSSAVSDNKDVDPDFKFKGQVPRSYTSPCSKRKTHELCDSTWIPDENDQKNSAHVGALNQKASKTLPECANSTRSFMLGHVVIIGHSCKPSGRAPRHYLSAEEGHG